MLAHTDSPLWVDLWWLVLVTIITLAVLWHFFKGTRK